jgi:hypothetical protein
MRNGECTLHKVDEPVFVKDPIIREDPSQSSCEGPSTYPFISDSYAPPEADLSSPSMVVKATSEMQNVDDDACLARSEIIANVLYYGGQDEYLGNTLLIFEVPSAKSASWTHPTVRRAQTVFWEPPVAWSSSPDVCCERSFQTTWTVTVPQCEGW